MKLLSIAVPCYNSEAYMEKCLHSLLIGGDEVEILIVDDGSKDGTAAIADRYERDHPGIVRAIHQVNGGHGDAVMTGLKNATGRYFKVCDSDDWLDEEAFPRVLEALRTAEVDLFICNYIYDKVGEEHKKVIRYGNALPQGRVLHWNELGHFRMGQYILMHAAIYRTELLRTCGMTLPKHTFYVDNLYVFIPLRSVETIMYMDADLYHYYIGRQDQSVNEEIMIRRIDQQLLVNRIMLETVDLTRLEPAQKREYMFNYLEIITTVSSILLVKSGTEENLAKKRELWEHIRTTSPEIYKKLRRRPMGICMNLPGRLGRAIMIGCYRISQRIFGFN